MTSLSANDFRTPPFITQSAPVPAQAIHFRNPRRSMPSFSTLSLMNCDICVFLPSANLQLPDSLPPTHAKTRIEREYSRAGHWGINLPGGSLTNKQGKQATADQPVPFEEAALPQLDTTFGGPRALYRSPKLDRELRRWRTRLRAQCGNRGASRGLPDLRTPASGCARASLEDPRGGALFPGLAGSTTTGQGNRRGEKNGTRP